MEQQLVDATWGLVCATALLFLAALVPALAQFVAWSNTRRALVAELIPALHAARANLEELRAELLPLPKNSSEEGIETALADAERIRRNVSIVEKSPSLTLDQRLEFTVLMAHLDFLIILLGQASLPEDKRVSAFSTEECLRRSLIRVQASLLTLHRLNDSFPRVRRKYHGRTFTQEMIARNGQSYDEAEKQLVDIRRLMDDGGHLS